MTVWQLSGHGGAFRDVSVRLVARALGAQMSTTWCDLAGARAGTCVAWATDAWSAGSPLLRRSRVEQEGDPAVQLTTRDGRRVERSVRANGNGDADAASVRSNI